jgi:Asp-tRNA(Asn)/Glu-tRNA(Gln) amidotransferase A subunit family amidase
VRSREAVLSKRGSAKVSSRNDSRRALKLALKLDGPDLIDSPIANMRAVDLLEAMRSRKLRCLEVVRVFCARALLAGETFNCNTEELFAEAIEAAVNADKMYDNAKPGDVLPPMLGLPISIKDNLAQKGTDTTCGLAVRADKPYSDDGGLVKALRDSGAIPFVRTTVPQALLQPETDSFWGLTTNPYNTKRTPGGSSGGEGALLAFRGSPLGIGTDIGGSIRIPAAFCGIYGFKPTPARMTRQGQVPPRVNNRNGFEGVMSVSGPMGSSVDDLALIMKTYYSPVTWKEDNLMPQIPWNDDVYKSNKSLRIGNCSASYGR